MKKIVALLVALTVALGGINYSDVATTDVSAAEIGWNLVWSDEFDGTSLDTSIWNYEIGTGHDGWGNQEKQYYTDREENVSVSDGTLKIKALKESYKGSSYTSARITTQGKKSFTYGKIEARIKLPQYSGAWPAFWTLGETFSTEGWPKCGEIDIMEAINDENLTYGALHWHVESASYTGQGDADDNSADVLASDYQRTEWHTYGIIWNETKIQWYVDDQIFLTKYITAESMSEFHKDQFIILNQAVGGQWPGYNIDDTAFPDKSVMEVDYVRVYESYEIPETTTELSLAKSKVKSAEKTTVNKVKLSLKKVDQAVGYKIKISTSKKFKNKTTITKTVKKNKVNIKNKLFKNASKLYVKARAYAIVDDKKVYGKWSNIKKVKM